MKIIGMIIVWIEIILNIVMLSGLVYSLFRKEKEPIAYTDDAAIIGGFTIMGVIFIVLGAVYLLSGVISEKF